ncbi:MAG TPA: glycosyltransferase [Anaeromyxobacteraceae bacterium]|nr:glycosyltransferase [Anaeromyxobacteraceae bacterium]
MSRLVVVAIGRNEGERLARCLASIPRDGTPVVYVDSGSTDGSADLAARAGADVVRLDPARPFSAARARNEGVERALASVPGVAFVQFVDGDCELAPGWLSEGERILRARDDVAAVCGRVRERQRDRTIYNRLCDLEWDVPPGEVASCGGIAMMRVDAFGAEGGFAAALVAGEEPELCVRLRRRGWVILRVRDEMATHDAAMVRFAQWWRRAQRGGWAYAQGVALHGAPPERHWVREQRSALAWGAVLPVAALTLALAVHGAFAALLVAYPLLGLRVGRWARRRGASRRDALLQGAFIVIAKFPEALGALQFHALRGSGRQRGAFDWRVAG